jgi:hypothetical protein
MPAPYTSHGVSRLPHRRRHDRDDQHHDAHRGECRGGTVIRTQTSPGPARRGLASVGIPAGRAVVCGLPAVSSGGSSTMTSSAAAVGFSSCRPADSTDTSGTASPFPASRTRSHYRTQASKLQSYDSMFSIVHLECDSPMWRCPAFHSPRPYSASGHEVRQLDGGQGADCLVVAQVVQIPGGAAGSGRTGR